MKPIYIVDDDIFMRDLCEKSLRGNFPDSPVYTYETGEEFLSVFNEEDPSIIILDFNFNNAVETFNSRNKNGLSVLRILNNEFEKVSVIMISGESFEALKDEAIEEGAFSYVCKNIHFYDNLVKTVQKAMKEQI